MDDPRGAAAAILPLWKGLHAVPAGLLFPGVPLVFWRFGVWHYRGTGR